MFALVGVLSFAYWIAADPSYEVSDSHSGWMWVLAFSAAILLPVLVLPVFAQFVGGRVTLKVSFVAAAGGTLSSFANVLEDGLQVGWAFFVVVLGTATMELGLLALTTGIAIDRRGGSRLLALVPAGTMAAIAFYVIAGGVLLLATWLAAAAVAVALPASAAKKALPSTS